MKNPKILFIQTHPDAQLPSQAHSGEGIGDTGYDLKCVADEITVPARSSNIIPVGLKVGFIEPGYWFKIEARSGLGFKHSVFPHFGIIDNQYQGSLGVKIYNLSDKDYTFKKGDGVAQFVVYELIQPKIDWIKEEDVINTARGEKGFGSSDKKQ